MVSKTDVGYYKSNNSGNGASRSSTEIVTATENNYFDDVTPAEQVGGHIEYRVFYVENKHATENMDDVDIWMSADQSSSASSVRWGVDPIAQHPVWPFHPAIFFDGSNDIVTLGNHASLWSQSLTKFSFSIWIFPLSAGDGSNRVVVDHGFVSNQGFRLSIDSASAVKVNFEVKNNVGTIFTAFSNSLQLNKWNHIVCTYDNTLGSQNGKIFVDNVLGSQTFNLTQALNLSANMDIGGTADDLHGYAKEFRWFTTKALTTLQIDDIFQGDQDNSADADYWQIFGEGTGSPTDEVGSLTATLSNGAEWRTSQRIPNSTTSPVGMTWLHVTNGPLTNTPNIGTLHANLLRECPFWVEWNVADSEQDAANEAVIFTVQAKIPQGGTAPPPSGGGGDPVPPATVGDFTFAVCGDWGTESMTGNVVDLIKNNNPKPQRVLSVGDNAYDSGSGAINDWLDFMKPIDDHQGSSIKLETAFGNHDNAESESSSNEEALMSHFGYDNPYHSFTHGNVHFLALDNTTETSFGSGSAQHNFAKADLKAARENPAIKWIVVYAHKPMFGGNSQHSYNDDNFNQAYFPMFDQYKVDLMFFGHNHHMSQSKQVKYKSSDPESPTVVDSSTPYTGGVGRIHIVIGTGGHDADDLYEVSSFSQTEWDNDTEHGAFFGTVTNSGSSSTLTGRFKDIDGNVLRTFVINR